MIWLEKVPIGKIGGYFNKIGVAIVDLTGDIKVGDKLSIEGRGSVIEQVVQSMQVEHKTVDSAKAGDSIGMKVDQPVKKGDAVFKIQ